MKVTIKGSNNDRTAAQPVGGIKTATELLQSLAMTMMLEKLSGRKTVTMEVDISRLDTNELKATVEQLSVEARQQPGSSLH